MIARHLADAETTDAAEDEAHGRDRSGDEIPDKLKRGESRMAKILEAKALLEERARADTAEEAAHRQTEGDQGIDVGLSAIAPETGRLEESTQELQHAMAVAQKLDPAYSKRHRISQDVAAAFMVIGEATLWTNRPAGAARAYRSAADFLVTALPAQRHSLADHLDSGHSTLKTPVQVQVLSSYFRAADRFMHQPRTSSPSSTTSSASTVAGQVSSHVFQPKRDPKVPFPGNWHAGTSSDFRTS